MAQFWLERHDYFRYECVTLRAGADEFRNARKSPEEFSIWIVPRLQSFLGSLHGHHQIEDFHYFPAFRAAQRSLEAGFDALARDHELLHSTISEIVEKVNSFLAAVRESSNSTSDAVRISADRYFAASALLFRRIERHLDDEEDLIIPVMLDRG